MLRIDFEYLAKFLLALAFIVMMGVLAAFTWGYLMILILFEALTNGS